MADDVEYKKAKQSALRLLKIRPRSCGEIRSKLQTKGFTQHNIESVISYLSSIQLLDDRAFTASWIRYRLARPFGFGRIIQELKLKGISSEIINECVAEIKGDVDSSTVIEQLVERKAKRLETLEPIKRKKRIFDFLLRRGFEPNLILKALQSIK